MTNKLQFKKYDKSEYDAVKEILLKDEKSSTNLIKELDFEPENIIVGYLDEKIVSMIQIEKGRNVSYLVVFVSPEYRQKSIGDAALNYAEEVLSEISPKEIMTDYLTTNENSRKFAIAHGYEKYYRCTNMIYTGGKFDIEQMPVRQYRDEDYPEGHELYAVAFHEMRVSVGDFPNSVVEKPSERNRKAWADDYLNRYTYIHNGEVAGHAHVVNNDVSSISVKPALHGQGIGTKFLKQLCNQIYDKGYNNVTLDCVVGNKAKHLYDRLGFKEIRTVEYGHKRMNKNK